VIEKAEQIDMILLSETHKSTGRLQKSTEQIIKGEFYYKLYLQQPLAPLCSAIRTKPSSVWRFFKTDALKVKPFDGAICIIAGDHFSKRNLSTDAVHWLIVAYYIVINGAHFGSASCSLLGRWAWSAHFFVRSATSRLLRCAADNSGWNGAALSAEVLFESAHVSLKISDATIYRFDQLLQERNFVV
jgi:hypothetical protein